MLNHIDNKEYFCIKALNYFLTENNEFFIKNSNENVNEKIILFLIKNTHEGERQAFCLNALNYYLDKYQLDTIKLSLFLDPLTRNTRQEFCSKALNFYFNNNKLHEIEDLYPLIDGLTYNEREPFCSKALNFYFNNNKLHEIENLYLLIDGLNNDKKKSFSSKVLDHYLTNLDHHLTNNECHERVFFILLPKLAEEKKELLIDQALNHYLKNNKFHEIKFLLNFVSYEQISSFYDKVLHHYTNASTLFKHDTIIKDYTTIPEHTFLISPEKFIQKIDTLNVDEKYQKQLYMYYIRKKIENPNRLVSSLDFTEDLLKPLSVENIVTVIEFTRESVDNIKELRKKIKPLCEAYLTKCKDLPTSMPIKHFTHLFHPFRTKIVPLFEQKVGFLAKIIDSMGTFKSLFPKTPTPLSTFKGNSSKRHSSIFFLEPNTPEEIQKLYTQYKYKDIVDGAFVVSKDKKN